MVGWPSCLCMRGVKTANHLKWCDWSQPNHTEWSSYAQSRTDVNLVKGMLTGPVTILNWSFPRRHSLSRILLFFKSLLQSRMKFWPEAAGVKIIQIGEAVSWEIATRRSDWYEDLPFGLGYSSLPFGTLTAPDTQIHTHMCYSEFTDIIPAIDNMDADVISFEASCSKPWNLWRTQSEKLPNRSWPGAYVIHSPCVLTKAKSPHGGSKLSSQST